MHHDVALEKKFKKTDSRMSFDLKMSQSLIMIAKTLTIRCLLAENPKEKEYNFSLKMIGHRTDFNSEHSSNIKNPLFRIASEIREGKEDAPENYIFKDFEEGKRFKTRNYFSAMPNSSNLEKRSLTKIDEEGQSPAANGSSPRQRAYLVRNESSEYQSSPSLRREKPDVKDLKKDFLWSHQATDKDIPTIEMRISGSDFNTNSLQFYLWSVKTSEGQGGVDTVFIDHKLVGECYISLNKIYSDLIQSDNAEQEPIRILHKKIKISEKLWNHGVFVGSVEGEFLFEYNQFYRQMICGVNTESGVQKSTKIVLAKDGKSIFDIFKKTLNKEITLLSQMKDTLIENVFKLSARKPPNKIQELKIIDEMAQTLARVVHLLTSSQKGSVSAFIYKNSEDLLTSQKVMIDLAKHLIECCDQVQLSLRPLYFECLTLIILRGELELNFMGFDSDLYTNLIESASKANLKTHTTNAGSVDVKNVKQKMKVAVSYQGFLYQTLKKVLQFLNRGSVHEKEQNFVEIFCAIAYFRVPEFRGKLLECLTPPEDEDLNSAKWRGDEWIFAPETDENKKNRQVISLFDWDENFYAYLKGTPKAEQNMDLLKEILNETSWKNRFAKRGKAFFLFLNEWTKHVNKTVVVKDHVPWQDLPGYNLLIKNVLLELKQRDLKALPEAFLETTVSLLRNEKLLNILVTVLYHKTRVYDSSNVFAVFNVINVWFKAMQTHRKTIPSTFDYNFFLKGLFMVIDGDHALNIAKVLWVLYNNFNIFPGNPDQETHE